MKRMIVIIMFFTIMFVMASVCYAQTLEQLKAERDGLADDLQAYRLKAQANIRAEVRLIRLDAIITDREKQAREAAKIEKVAEKKGE